MKNLFKKVAFGFSSLLVGAQAFAQTTSAANADITTAVTNSSAVMKDTMTGNIGTILGVVVIGALIVFAIKVVKRH